VQRLKVVWGLVASLAFLSQYYDGIILLRASVREATKVLKETSPVIPVTNDGIHSSSLFGANPNNSKGSPVITLVSYEIHHGTKMLYNFSHHKKVETSGNNESVIE
jgi:hypothetical protein